MSVFEFQRENGEKDDPSESDIGVETVGVLTSSNGEGSLRFRATIPVEFARDMGLQSQDTLVMKHEKGSNTIEVSTPE